MNAHIIREIIEDAANHVIPDPSNLWPDIARRLAARERKRTLTKAARRSIIVVLAIFAAALLASPQLRVAVARAIMQVVGISGWPDGPTVFTPQPPFVVKEPGYLPAGFTTTWTVYNPGRDPQTGELLPSMQIQKAPAAELGWGPSERLAQRVKGRSGETEVYLLFGYEARGDQYLLLFERAARPAEQLPAGEPRHIGKQAASLQYDDQVLRLTWIAEGTWIEMESTLTEAETLKVAEGLETTPALDLVDSTGRTSLPIPHRFCNPQDQPPSRFMLGQVEGQAFRGSVHIELHDRPRFPESVAFGSDVPNVLDVLKPALAALKDPALPMQRLSYPSIGSFRVSEPEQCLVPDPSLQGYLVIEVWEHQVNLGYGGAGAEQRERAIKALEEEIRARESP